MWIQSIRLGRRAAAMFLGLMTAAVGTAAASPPGLSQEGSKVLQWVLQSSDHRAEPFAIIDKRLARLWLFDAAGRPVDNSPVLLGSARGDSSAPDIGERALRDIKPHERTTPAGRFVMEPGRNLHGEDIFWVDYDAAVSLHRVRAHNAAEKRLQRLDSATPADNRISYGCINVPTVFYDRQVAPLFKNGRGLVYVLPETTPLAVVFPSAQRGATTQPMPPSPSATAFTHPAQRHGP